MKQIFLVLSLIGSTAICSQNYFFGDFQSRYQLEKNKYLSKNQHTLSKPYLINYKLDSLRQKGIWNYSSSLNKSNIKILPIGGFSLNYDLEKQLTSKSFNLGFQFNSKYKNCFYTQFRTGINRSELNYYEALSTYKRPFFPTLGYLTDTLKKLYSRPFFEGQISYEINKYFVLSSGIGKNFFGDGYRSLWLSDYAPTYPFLKLESTFWKAKYINLWSLHDDLHTNLFSRHKWSSSHMLSLNVTNWLNLSLFESVVWQNKDTLNGRGFDINYINPFVFYRPIEYGIGSSDNSFLGAGIKTTFLNHYIIYSNIIFDEFLLSQFKNNNGWWGNKYGFQAGFKAFDIFDVEGLYAILEWNWVRPYTFSHMTSMQNYGHQNHSLAHPLESNFFEALAILTFQRGNYDFYLSYHFQKFGKDYNTENYGGNMFNSYNNRYSNNNEYGHFVGQGVSTEQQIISSRISYMLFPITNTKLFAQINLRYTEDVTSTLFNFGISSSLWQPYLDY